MGGGTPGEAAEELAAALPNAELEVHNQSLH